MSQDKNKKRRVKTLVTGKNKKVAQDFADAFFVSVREDECAGWTPEALSAVATSMFDLASRLKRPSPGMARVYTLEDPDPTDEYVPPSIVEIVSRDMAFVMDSISSELAFRGLHIDTLFRPTMNVSRGKTGAITGVSPGAGHTGNPDSESYFFIRLEQTLTPDACEDLAKRLTRVLKDVYHATSDWRDMMKKMSDLAESMPQGEARALLSYLHDSNFTFLGYRRFTFGKEGAKADGKTLGVLRGTDISSFHTGYKDALARQKGAVLVTKMVDRYSSVHRRVPMDAVSVRITDAKGRVTGMHLFVGLFTSSTYSCRTVDVPYVREKVRATVARAGFRHGSHDHRALEHILEKMPRDELFQVTEDDLYKLALGILRLQDKHRIALFTHKDPLRRYMSCLVYAPRDRYNTKFRIQAAKLLEKSFGGALMNYFTTLDDSALARVLFMIRLPEGKPVRAGATAAAEKQLIEMGREWDEQLRHVLAAAYGRARGVELTAVYGHAFTSAYHESTEIGSAVHDIRHLEALHENNEQIRVELYRPSDAPPGEARLKVYNRGAPVPLSAIMPLLENMGLSGVSEMPFPVRPEGRAPVWIHDFILDGAEDIDLSDEVKANFEGAFLQVWHGHVENDALNRLVTAAGLTWREVRLFRAYRAYLRQTRYPYTSSTVAEVLGAYPRITRALLDLFEAMHSPAGRLRSSRESIAVGISAMIQSVERADHDRILRLFRQLIEKTLRTNYFQEGKEFLSFKFDSKNIDGLPLPRPHVEIFVYSPRLEAVHLRGGEIARGGIRWSDRPDDFRTEVLGLMKAQTVKNTIIVPTGAKGGFVVKQPPKSGDRAARQAEGIACYKIFIQALLDITDNTVRGKIVRPEGVVCHDGPDPYLVVAADKGTATFSDIANEISLRANFWLGDAFASGGSAGYDHKAMGITARGAWESVKRHFRALGKEIQEEPFTAVGVGDMGGDVFGNGMLLSKKTRLVGAFNHLHIFCDPDPDPETSYAERERLFKRVLGWDNYSKDRLSPGGAIFDRKAKSIKVSPQIRKRFGLATDTLTPDDLIRAMLKAEVELLWFAGIGTFIKSSRQSQTDADDKTNDAIRINGDEVRAQVVGEGANLGVTQLGRVEYARRGGRINTDFIDNSAGVDCSDHEVNIKILLSDVMAGKKMTLPKRNKLLERMTNDVAELVLQNNYQQNLSLTLQQHTAKELVGVHGSLIHMLERGGLIHRALEGLPDDETLARLGREGQGVSRPELCILMSWAKIALYRDVITSDIPDDPSMAWMLEAYFPGALRKYGKEIGRHSLKREIVAAGVVNSLVNRMGAAFVHSRIEKTGSDAVATTRAFLIAAEAFGLRALWQEVEALDGKVPGDAQISALLRIYQFCKRVVTWLLRFGPEDADVAREIAALRPAVDTLKKDIARYLQPEAVTELQVQTETLVARGLPRATARALATLVPLASACDIINITRHTKGGIGHVAEAYFRTGEALSIDWLRTEALRIVPANSWQNRVIGSLLDDCYIHQADIAAQAASDKDWFRENAATLSRHGDLVNEVRNMQKPDLDMLVLVVQKLGQIGARAAA